MDNTTSMTATTTTRDFDSSIDSADDVGTPTSDTRTNQDKGYDTIDAVARLISGEEVSEERPCDQGRTMGDRCHQGTSTLPATQTGRVAPSVIRLRRRARRLVTATTPTSSGRRTSGQHESGAGPVESGARVFACD